MRKSLIIYFSQSGSTRRVAEHIAAGLAVAGCPADLHRLDRSAPPDPSDYDLLGIGSPVHYYRLPFNVTEYLRELGPLGGLPTFAFVTYGTTPGSALTTLRQTLNQKGAVDAGTFCAQGRDLYLPYLKRGYLFAPDAPTPEELLSAEEFGRQCATMLDAPAAPAHAQPGLITWIHRLERLTLNPWLTRHIFSRFLRVNGSCNQCGLCVRSCPTGNIVQGENGVPRFGRDCLLCASCELKCPQNAISSPLDWALLRPFISYNVHRAAADPNVEHVRVSHDHGVTREL